MIRKTATFAAAALALGAHPAAAEVVAKSDSGFVSRLAVEVKAAPAEAWKALVAPNTWWNKEHTYTGDAANLYIDPQAGGCFCEKLKPAAVAPAGARPGSAEHMRVIYVEPGRILRMSGGLGPLQSEAAGAVMTMTLKPVAGGTRILWEYVVGGYMRYKVEEIAPAVDQVMAGQLASLAARLGPLAGPAKPSAEATPAKP
jgi:uncharacterized protein YndB with AHSA1/START domain